MVEKLGIFALCIAGLLALGGCATVDPRLDYDRAAEHVRQTTGQESLYRPGDEEIVERKIEELLADGLTADEAVQVCLLNNPRLQAAFFDVGIARADVVQSGLLSNPSLGVSLRLPSGGGLANLEAGLAQNIVELWQIPVRKRVAERTLDQAVLELARQAGVLATEAKTAYYHAVAADQGRRITSENLDIVRQLLDLALARQEAGVGTEVEVNLSRSELRETELALRSAKLAAFEARSELATLLGLTMPPDNLELAEVLPGPPEWTLTTERLLETARAWRLDIKAARQAVEAAAANVKLERLRVFPVVELGFELERGERKRSRGRKLFAETARSSVEAGELTAPGFEPNEDEGTDFIIGPSISLELPIFDQNQAQIAVADYAYFQAAKMLDALAREVTQETRLAHARAKAAWDTARFYRDRLLPLRETNLELARDAYGAGKASFLSVLEAQRTLLEARAGYVGALEASAVALPELERVTGQPIQRILARDETDENTPAGDGEPPSPNTPETDQSGTTEERK